MTQEDIIRMAREAGFETKVLNSIDGEEVVCFDPLITDMLKDFAALVAAHEREKQHMVRAIALEEAAQLCMDYGREGFSAHVIARAIKGLK